MDDLSRNAMATTAGGLGAVFIALWANLEQPFWAALSAIIIANTDRTALFTKGVLRIIGTLVGVVGGYFLAQLLEGQPIAQALALMMAAGFGTYGRLRAQHGYAFFYAALSFILVLVCSMTTPEQLFAFAHYRCYEIMAGVVAATVANWALGARAGELPTGVVSQAIGVSVEEAARQGLSAAAGGIVIVVTWAIFNLPALTQVLASSLVIIDSSIAATRHRGAQRIWGCIIGGSVGLAAIAINPANLAWWLLALTLGTFIFSRIHLGGTPNAYIGTQAALGFLITLVGTAPPSSIEPTLDRLIGILIGVSIMSTVVWTFSTAPPAATAAAAAPPTPPPQPERPDGTS